MVLVVMGETTVKETGIKNDVGPFAKASSFGLPTTGPDSLIYSFLPGLHSICLHLSPSSSDFLSHSTPISIS